MKKIIYILLFLSFNSLSVGQNYFNYNYDVQNRSESFNSIIIDSNFYISNGFSALGNYSKNYLVKLNLQGDTIKTNSFGHDSTFYYSSYKSIIKTKNNYIISGTKIKAERYPFIAAINSNLDTLWTRNDWTAQIGSLYSSVNDYPYFVFAGNAKTGVSPDPNLFDLMVIKSDTLGNIIWQNIYPSPTDVSAYHIDTTIDGGYILSGYQYNSITDINIYVVKIDSLGNIQSGWPKVFSSSNGDAAWAKTLSDGSYLIYGGWDAGSVNEKAHARKLDQNGNTIWVKNFQGPSTTTILNYFTDAIELPNGDLVFTGSFFDPQTNNPSGWIIKTDGLGNEKWRRTLRLRTNDHYLYGIVATPDGGFALSGSVWPDGGGTTQDGWIIKLDSLGCVVSGCTLSVEEEDFISDVIIYPNPSNGKFYLESNNFQNSFYEIHDLNGKLIVSSKIISNKTEIDLFNNTGVFILSFQNSKAVFRKKIIITE